MQSTKVNINLQKHDTPFPIYILFLAWVMYSMSSLLGASLFAPVYVGCATGRNFNLCK